MAEKPGLGLVTLTAEKLKDSEVLKRNGILDIVAVHGLCGDRQTSWARTFSISWLQDHLPAYLAHARVSTYGYELSEEGVSAADIDEKAKELLDTFCNGRLADTNYPRKFVFIGHNLGGCIIKQALLRANADPVYSDIAKNTALLLFFGTPQRAGTQVEWETLAYNLIHATGQNNNGPLSEILRRTSFALKDVNQRYAKLARTYNVISICENLKLDSIGTRVFDKHASTMGVPNETAIFREADHFNMCRDIDETDELFNNICDSMVSSLTPDSLYIDSILTFSLLSGRSQVSPSPLSTFLEPGWILTDESYLKFINESSGILQLCGTTGSGLSVLSSFLPKFIKDSVKTRDSLFVKIGEEAPQDPTIISFSFDSRDYRTCCTSVLFASLTRQLLGVDPGYFRYIRHIYTRILWNRDWSLESVWVLFRSTILGSAVGPVYCIINAIDRCDPERDHFLDDFLKLALSPDAKLKIVFTNNAKDINRYPSTLTIDINKRQVRQKDMEECVDHEISKLIQLRPGFHSFSSDIKQLVLGILAIDPSFLFISLLSKWFCDNQTRSTLAEIQSVVDGMPSSLDNIFQKVFIPCTPSSHWKFKSLSWIAHAFRPLNAEELATALAIEYSGGVFSIDIRNRPQSLVEDLKRIFGAFVILRGDGVSLVHESARDFLLQSEKEWDHIDWDKTEEENGNRDHKLEDPLLYGHARISSICLDYLLNATWEELATDVGNSNLESLPSPNGTSSLFSYAARYWYVHYRLAEKHPLLLEKARNFLENDERRTLWAHVEWLEGNKLARRRKTSNSLNIAAELGLNNILLSMIDTGPKEPGETSHVLAVAAERGDVDLIKELEKRGIVATESDPLRLAAQNGHLSVVRHLLGGYMQQGQEKLETALGAALHAASESGYELMVEELLDNKANASALVNGLTPLHCAAEFGHVQICRRLMEEGIDVDAAIEDGDGSTPLHLATLSGQLNTIQYLLESGANIDSKDKAKLCPLHRAAASGLDDAVELLLSWRAPVNSINSEGKTALHVAVDRCQTKSVIALLAGGADINITCSSVGTPLHVVARSGNLEIARLLLEADYPKADLSLVDGDKATPLHLAARYGHTTLVQLLLKHDPNADESEGWDETLRTALNLAATNGSFGIVKALLLDLSDREDSEDDDPYAAPLLAAATRGNLRTVTALVKAGAEPLWQHQAFTALHTAAELGDVEVISALLEARLNLGDDPTDGLTPLHPAVKSGSVRAVEMLLYANAEVDTRDADNGRTVLLEAAALGYAEIVEVLLDAGATVSISDDAGSSFLHLAAGSGNLKILNLALTKGVDVLGADENDLIPLHTAVEASFIAAVAKFLSLESALEQVNARTSRHRTALHLAAKRGKIETVELLLKAGSSINDVEKKKLTPLHLASKKAYLELAKLLLQEAADPNLIDCQGRTPLFVAYEKQNTDLIKLLQPVTTDLNRTDISKNTLLHVASRRGMLEVENLISLHLDIESRNDQERTPISLAAEWGHLSSVKTLIDAGANLNYLDDQQKTVLSRAICSGDKDIVIALLEKGAEPELDGSYWPAIYSAAFYGRADLLQEFLQRGFDMNKKGGSSGWTPIHAAYDSAKVTEILLDAGVKLDVLDNSGSTMLDLAVKHGYEHTVEVYMKKGLDPLKGRSSDGKTSLHIAATSRSVDCLSLLLEYAKGEDLDVKDHEGLTPLQDAVDAGRDVIVRALISSSKCNLKQKDTDDKGLLLRAAEKGNFEIVKLLVDSGAEIESSQSERLLKLAAEKKTEEMMELFLKKGATIEPSFGESLLKDVIENGSLKMVELVVENVAEIEPSFGEVLLKDATEKGNLKMIELLVGKGAGMEPPLGDRLLKLAAETGSLSLVNAMLAKEEKIVNPNTTDEHGWTAEMFAQASGHSDVAKALQGARENLGFTLNMLKPSALGEVSKSVSLEVDKSGLKVQDTTPKDGRERYSCILANHPIPILGKSFYFEIKVLDEGSDGVIGIGLATEDSPLDRMPGWSATSWAYHGDDGRKFHDGHWGMPYVDRKYGKDDIVGCLYDPEKKELSFTHSGDMLGTAFEDVNGRLFPVVGLGKGTQVEINFGDSIFKFKEFKQEKEKVERLRPKTPAPGIRRVRTLRDLDEAGQTMGMTL